MNSSFHHFLLELPQPSFDSPLTSIILELEKLRYKRIQDTHVYPLIFSQIKEIFQLLESLESVRIEGNNTTLSELIEKTIEGKKSSNEQMEELENIQAALKFADDYIQKGTKIDRAFISELHRLVVSGLKRDGDRTPGIYRSEEVKISNSNHQPPRPETISSYMEEFFDFIGTPKEIKYNLLVTALAHHRFVWIHPFRNGNGGVVRLLTYSMLVSQGFMVGNILNPTAVFCNDRNKYYEFLAKADSGLSFGIEEWCHYVLSNLLIEMNKIEKLLDHKYLTEKILFPALKFSLEKEVITEEERSLLKVGIELGEFKAGDFNKILGKKNSSQVTRIINKLKNQKMIYSLPNSPRKYGISLVNNYLLRGVIHYLSLEGFIPFKD
ncbi:MAG: Fic family protein [Candidatus Margulisbacteria bacterium]|nr:Fic family protein [Candidatus Margulisiibacteriota bacterium]